MDSVLNLVDVCRQMPTGGRIMIGLSPDKRGLYLYASIDCGNTQFIIWLNELENLILRFGCFRSNHNARFLNLWSRFRLPADKLGATIRIPEIMSVDEYEFSDMANIWCFMCKVDRSSRHQGFDQVVVYVPQLSGFFPLDEQEDLVVYPSVYSFIYEERCNVKDFFVDLESSIECMSRAWYTPKRWMLYIGNESLQNFVSNTWIDVLKAYPNETGHINVTLVSLEMEDDACAVAVSEKSTKRKNSEDR